MDNSDYNTDWMIQLPKEHVRRLYDDAADLLAILNEQTPDIHHQVATCCYKPRPLCRGSHWCVKPCAPRDPWDETLLPKLRETECIHEWLGKHGITHGHPFYHNFCEMHMGQFERSNGEWVPSKPRLERSMARHCVPVEEQEGPLYYIYDSSDLEGVDIDDLVTESSELEQNLVDLPSG